MRNKQKGFSLIELLIVVAIILIIAAIAIPNLMRAKMAANEASAVGAVRTIITSEVSYSNTYGTGFAAALLNLAPPAGGCSAATPATAARACLIDPVLGAGTKSGYTFLAAGNGGTPNALNPHTGFEVAATPLTVGTTGQRSYCGDQSGVLHYDTTGTAVGVAAGNCAAIPVAQVLQ